MTESVPPPEPLSSPEQGAEELDALSSRLNMVEERLDLGALSAEAKHRDLLISEIRQRIEVRNWVVVIAIVVMVFMGGVLSHAAHQYFWGPVILISPSIAIVMFVGPMVSITTITVMLLIGAFRRFKDDDLKVNVSSLAAEAVKAGQGL